MDSEPVDLPNDQRSGRRAARRLHVARVLPSPIKGVFSTHIDSDHQFGRHWHDSYGFGFLEHGAQTWWSGAGHVRAYPGDVISTTRVKCTTADRSASALVVGASFIWMWT